MISIFVVDDHPLACLGLKQVIDSEKGFKFVGFSNKAEEALENIRRLQPDVIMLDVAMPGMDGFEAARRLIRTAPDSKILIVTAHKQMELATRLLQLGVHGYLVKEEGNKEIISAIRSVHSGKRYLPINLAQEIAMQKVDNISDSPFELLSKREWQVAACMLRGLTVVQIADLLHLTAKTVHGHRYKILYKLDAQNDIQFYRLAKRYNMLDEEKRSS